MTTSDSPGHRDTSNRESTSDQLAPHRSPALAADVGLAVVFAALLAVTAYAIADSWGATSWQFDCAAGAVVCAIALVRRRHRAWTALGGLAVAVSAMVIARSAGLPHEPAPAMALALAVLVGSAIRALPASRALAMASTWLAVVVGDWALGGFRAVTVFHTVACLTALAVGASLRRYFWPVRGVGGDRLA